MLVLWWVYCGIAGVAIAGWSFAVVVNAALWGRRLARPQLRRPSPICGVGALLGFFVISGLDLFMDFHPRWWGVLALPEVLAVLAEWGGKPPSDKQAS